MTRPLAILAALLIPFAAAAQEPPQAQPPQPETRAMGQMVMEGVQREAQLRAQVFALQDEIARLKAQTKAAENKPAEAPKP